MVLTDVQSVYETVQKMNTEIDKLDAQYEGCGCNAVNSHLVMCTDRRDSNREASHLSAGCRVVDNSWGRNLQSRFIASVGFTGSLGNQ